MFLRYWTICWCQFWYLPQRASLARVGSHIVKTLYLMICYQIVWQYFIYEINVLENSTYRISSMVQWNDNFIIFPLCLKIMPNTIINSHVVNSYDECWGMILDMSFENLTNEINKQTNKILELYNINMKGLTKQSHLPSPFTVNCFDFKDNLPPKWQATDIMVTTSFNWSFILPCLPVFPLRPYVAKLAQHFEKLAQQNFVRMSKKRCFSLII